MTALPEGKSGIKKSEMEVKNRKGIDFHHSRLPGSKNGLYSNN